MQPRALLGLAAEEPGSELGGACECVELALAELHRGCSGVGAYSAEAVQAVVDHGVAVSRRGHAAVHDDRAEGHARPVLDGVRRVDQLVDRRLLGEGHQDHLATGRVRQQLDHLGGLLLDRPHPHRVERAPGPTAGSSRRGRPPARRARSGRRSRSAPAASPCRARGCRASRVPRWQRRRAHPID